MHAKLEIGKMEDVIGMRQELGRARENLAEVKAIQLFISQQRPAITSTFLSHLRKVRFPYASIAGKSSSHEVLIRSLKQGFARVY